MSRDITPEDYDLLLALDASMPETSSNSLTVADCEKLPKPAEGVDLEEAECAVCLGEMSATDEICGLPCCNHMFHRSCIVEWLTSFKMKCPLDNQDVILD